MDVLPDTFGALFNKLGLPVLVCRVEDDLPVVFMNSAAKTAFPNTAGAAPDGAGHGLDDVLRFKFKGQFNAFARALCDSGFGKCPEAVIAPGDVEMSVRIHAGAGVIESGRYLFIYVDPGVEPMPEREGVFLAGILDASHQINDVDQAIQAILAMAGEYADVSRAYIFENIPPDRVCNTYEWCAADIVPAAPDLQSCAFAEYGYQSIMSGFGMIVVDDVDKLPRPDRQILEKQMVRSLAILPLQFADQRVGFIGFDDCRATRRWKPEEMRILQLVGGVVASLIHRRNAEREAKRSLEIVKTVTDNLDDLVYVTDPDTYELKFCSQSLARALGRPVEEILGRHCWEVLHRDQNGPCSFCPVPRLLERHAGGESGTYVWELHNNVTGKWYMVKDSIVRWIDGARAHLGTFVDITYRKQYEEQLKRFAATDAMTDVYNRKWGYGKLDELFHLPAGERGDLTMCFIDLDGLKLVNDRLGHAAGDELIVNTIRAIFSCIRREDFICRWGGDEFILVLHCNQADASRVMDKVLFAIDHFNATQGKPYAISISFGLVDFAGDFASLDEVIDEADRRMYANKMLKRSGSKIFPREVF